MKGVGLECVGVYDMGRNGYGSGSDGRYFGVFQVGSLEG